MNAVSRAQSNGGRRDAFAYNSRSRPEDNRLPYTQWEGEAAAGGEIVDTAVARHAERQLRVRSHHQARRGVEEDEKDKSQ